MMNYHSESLNSSFEAVKVGNVLKRKAANRELKNSQWRCAVGCLMSAFLICDLQTQIFSYAIGLNYYLIQLAEWLLAAIVVICTLCEIGLFLYRVLLVQYVDVSESEKRLLGVLDSEPGFRKSPVKSSPPPTPRAIKFSPPCLNHPHRSPVGSMSSTGVVGASPLSLDESMLHSIGSYGSFNGSFAGKSFGSNGGSLTPFTVINDRVEFRKRKSPTRYLSPERDSSIILSQEALDSFLNTEAVKESKELVAQVDINDSHVSSFWNVNRTVMDYIPMLRRFKYQVAAASASSSASLTSDSDQPSKYPARELWDRLGASQDDVELWIENLRYWLGQTVMKSLADEIHKVNKELRSAGSEDTQVGEVNVSTLKNVAFVKSSLVPTLNNIIPYLEVSSNQEYLVNRLKALGNDGCIAAFNWDGGSSFNGKPWEDHLPTDSAIVMHAFCTYLDARLPSNPKYPDGKAFSSQHHLTAQEKLSPHRTSDGLILHQVKVNPPHYRVVIGKDTYDLPKGRNNLFHAILLFVHEIKQHRKGMLGNVSIGSSGVNMQWILTHKYR